MKAGDLVKYKSDSLSIHVGHLIYVGKGLWCGWGNFLFPSGEIAQVQLTSVEVVCK